MRTHEELVDLRKQACSPVTFNTYDIQCIFWDMRKSLTMLSTDADARSARCTNGQPTCQDQAHQMQ
jgi:hypothetical protein